MTSQTMNCSVCGQGTAHRVREVRAYPVGRWSVTIEDEFYRCDRCGEEFYTPEQSEASDRRALERAHEQHGLLYPEEIQAIRESLGVTQAEFEELLGVGKNTAVRWENGYVRPNAATNALLRLLQANPENARLLAGWHGVKLAGAA